MYHQDLIFVRHAESIGNTMSQDERAKLSIPNHKYPITETGRKQAKITGKWLKSFLEGQRTLAGDYGVNDAVQSTFLRNQETLRIILDEIGEPIVPVTDSRLDEKWDGIFHELTMSEIEERYPEQIRLRDRSGYYHYRAPGGENCSDVELRITDFVRDLGRPNRLGRNFGRQAGSIGSIGCRLILCHGRWFQIFKKVIHGLSVDEFLAKSSSGSNCAVTVYNPQMEVLLGSYVPWKGMLDGGETNFA